MYYSTDYEQLPLEEFFLPFGGSLDPKNRWVKLSRIMPWEKIEEIYLRTMSTETGRQAYSSQIAFGSIYIKEAEKLTDESCVTAIQENPYMQYFLGLHEAFPRGGRCANQRVRLHRQVAGGRQKRRPQRRRTGRD